MCSVSATLMMLLLACNTAVRIGLRNRVAPATRDKIFGAAVLTALAHAGYVCPCAQAAICVRLLAEYFLGELLPPLSIFN